MIWPSFLIRCWKWGFFFYLYMHTYVTCTSSVTRERYATVCIHSHYSRSIQVSSDNLSSQNSTVRTTCDLFARTRRAGENPIETKEVCNLHRSGERRKVLPFFLHIQGATHLALDCEKVSVEGAVHPLHTLLCALPGPKVTKSTQTR